MRSYLQLFTSTGMAMSLLLSTTLLAHEDHHTHTNIPLWQIATAGGLALAIYFGLMAWRKRRTNRTKKQ